jgi:ABC-type molybdate transport system ATPase subunit
MKNIEMSVTGNILTIKVYITKTFGPSKSGKTTIIASTEGNIGVPGKEEVRVGLNVYKSK